MANPQDNKHPEEAMSAIAHLSYEKLIAPVRLARAVGILSSSFLAGTSLPNPNESKSKTDTFTRVSRFPQHQRYRGR
jgi:hypothetical protein